MVWIKIEPVWVLSFLQRSGKPNLRRLYYVLRRFRQIENDRWLEAYHA